ncbi:MAG TPA: exodeoxyribonuclease V subunit gamma [Arachnia sp.]|nr:exodeoxyribonuclease V subunit gamma [Arachnia sp.]
MDEGDFGMSVTAVLGARWGALMDHLVETLHGLGLGPFEAARVLVATHETARLVGQEVAARVGISAGIDYLTPADLVRQLADAAGVHRERARWLGTPLDLAVQKALDDVADGYPLLRGALEADARRPGRRRATAIRLARLLRSYVELAPELVASWLDGGATGPGGAELPQVAAWQPELMRAAVARLELDPLAVLAAVEEVANRDTTPTMLVGIDHLSASELRIIESLASRREVRLIQKAGTPGAQWATALATRTLQLPGDAAPAPVVALHDSHGEARQVEVMRDELTRLFAADPTLEPRDVVVVCPQPERFAPLLDAAFAPGVRGASHPGRSLRVHSVGLTPPNPLVLLLVDLMRLGGSRATASGLVELLLRPPIAHRWRLTDRATVVELIGGAGVRWGMDAAHRAQFGLGDVSQNTWLRGLDRLLVGLAVAPGEDAGVGLSGTEVVTASDMDTVGSLCEIVSRLRLLIASTAAPATIPGWVARCRAALDSLAGLPRTEEWQLTAAARALTRLETNHAADDTTLTRHEFSLLLADAAAGYRRRPAAGNGSLAVVPLGELPHVEFRVVALLGVTDDAVPGRAGAPADCLDLAEDMPDPRARRREQLLSHARSAELLLIVRQARSERTNGPAALPVAVDWLLERVGATPVPRQHPPTATSAGNFVAEPSFDAAAYAGALARRRRQPLPRRHERRRTEARSRPLGAIPAQVSLTQLSRFLADPARAFLQSAAGITFRQQAELTDDIPLETRGLDRWGIVNNLLDAWKSGLSGESVEVELTQRELHPPLEVGRLAFQAARTDAAALWACAQQDWDAELAEHAISLSVEAPGLGTLRLVDEVRTRGGIAVTVSASTGDEQVIRPWLESLALAAAGHTAPARLHRLERDYGQVKPRSQDFAPTDPDEALAHLGVIASAYILGHQRLLAVPAAAALTYARDVHQGALNLAEWAGPFRGYHKKWSWPGPSWTLFFDSDVGELFEDAPLPQDPGTHPSAFASWALALYTPLVRTQS